MWNKIDLWSGLCGVIAGDSRGLDLMTQKCSVINVPLICWAQGGKFIFSTKIQISSYAADSPGGIGKKLYSCHFFLSGDLDQMLWEYKGIDWGLSGWGPSSIAQSHLSPQKQVWIPRFLLKLHHFKYLKFSPLFLHCILGSESTFYWSAFISLLLLIDFKNLGLFIISFCLH